MSNVNCVSSSDPAFVAANSNQFQCTNLRKNRIKFHVSCINVL